MKRLVAATIAFVLANVVLFTMALSNIEGALKPLSGGYHMHFIAFFGLSFLLGLLLIHEKVMLPKPFAICFAYSAFIAVLIEFLQAGTGYRTFSVLDIVAGLIGAGVYSVLGMIAYEAGLFYKHWHKKK